MAIKLHIEKVIYGGSGLAHTDEGDAVFVPFTLPGELAEASLDERKSNFSEAALLRVLEPSPDRIEPGCLHFGVCGGCHYQQAFYETQLRIKRDILLETLTRSGLSSIPEISTLAAEPWAYRNRIRLRIVEVDGKFRVGYLRRGSSEFLPIQMCLIAAPLLWRAAEALLSVDETSPVWLRAAEEVEFFTTSDQSALQMMLFLRRQPAPSFETFCGKLQAKLPELKGVGIAIIERENRNRKAQRVRPGAFWGADGLNCSVGEERYWVSRGSFFQVNRFLIEDLVTLVTAHRQGALAWDLYAGVGLFSRALAKSFSEVVAVEASGGDLLRSFRGKGRRAIEATTVDFLRQAALERDRPDLVVMDPPRAGVGMEACSLLARIRPGEIVYVSCDPVTLGRDLKVMVDSGYRIHQLHMVDMFPQTFHQETVAILRHDAIKQ
ncbi:23S rRNA (uracil(1939)-C(5))-methyltransferase RlmD [Edaphobacter flagellatus]|uniref:23S rRNA (uracil(1939)-C(5))-methyltransferase RlmD n=1 Tax=Edaphobacter flagellatus TaxID=1933044 RepID=UPI0021B2A2C6|nr:23S rRNA (uracil(1939)-C(5))-methyltransferase RlmD [Edaphobacter flagellatus]